MDSSPRSSISSDSFNSGRSSPINGFDSSAALILVPEPDSEDTPIGASFDFSSDDDAEDDSDVQLERLRNSTIPPLSSATVFLYLFSPFPKLGALLIPYNDLSVNLALPAIILFAVLSAFTRQLWYMLARYVRRADLEEILVETFARGRGRERRRAVLRQLVRLSVGVLRVLVAALYLRFSVDLLLPYFPDVLTVPSRAITTLVLASFIAPVYSARSLASKRVVYASWISIGAYAAWFSCTTYMHAKHILVPVVDHLSLGKLWHGIPLFAFTFATSFTVPLYASLKGTVEPITPKPRRSKSFKLLSLLSVALAVTVILPLAFYKTSVSLPESPYQNFQTVVAVSGAASLLCALPSMLLPTPALPIPHAVRRATSFPVSKALIYLLTAALSILPAHITRVGSDIVLILVFLGTYVAPALVHITIHNFRSPLSIVVPPMTPSPLAPSDSRNDELLLRKERTLQRRRLGRRLIWDVSVWVLLVPVGGGGLVWAVGRMVDRW